jgi:hypothetical protein
MRVVGGGEVVDSGDDKVTSLEEIKFSESVENIKINEVKQVN